MKPFDFKVILSLLFLGCQSISNPIPHSSDLSSFKINLDSTPVVFVPGIKGSLLQNPDGELVWLDGKQALGFSTPDLRLLSNAPDLIPAGAVPSVTAIPYILDVDIYRPWLKTMSQSEKIDFSVFSYDWRKDNLQTRDRLILALENIQKMYKKKPILVGHSMGGMLSYSAINARPDLVDKLVLVGVPFQGGIGYMKDLYKGISIGLNSKIQSPCVNARYQTVYGFFPRLATWDSKDVAVDESGNTIDLDFFQEATWRENVLGFYAQDCSEEEIPSPSEFQTILDRALLFRKSLDPSPEFLKKTPQILVVHAKNRNTRKAIVRLEKPNPKDKTKKYWDVEKAPMVMGDGSVSFENSQPPPGFDYKTVLTEYEHSVLLNDPVVQKKILDLIFKN
jgi:pimeloyl-ACP methyl ester carboxylesterase